MSRLVACFLLLIVMAGTAQSQGLLSGAESVDFDPDHDRYLVSSYYTGEVIAIDLTGTQSVYKTGFAHTYGLHIGNGVLYVSIGATIKGFDLSTDAEVMSLSMPPLVHFDGITSDGAGHLYVVDVGGRVIKVTLSDLSYEILVSSGLPAAPQDITFDAVTGKLFLAAYDETSEIQSIDPESGAVTVGSSFNMGPFDGINCDSEGNLYISSHRSPGWLLKWDGQYDHAPAPVSLGHDEPAGNCVNERDKVVAVANLQSSTVDFISYADPDSDGRPDYQDNCPDTYNPDQADADNDGIGDVCDECTDTDFDGFGDPGFTATTCQIDNCPGAYNPDQADVDGDGIGDLCDNCPVLYNPDQADNNGNLIGDACETCCQGRVGDVNGEGGDEPTIGDISALIEILFISSTTDYCLAEADINQSGGVDPVLEDVSIGDISVLIDYLFITGSQLGLPDCL